MVFQLILISIILSFSFLYSLNITLQCVSGCNCSVVSMLQECLLLPAPTQSVSLWSCDSQFRGQLRPLQILLSMLTNKNKPSHFSFLSLLDDWLSIDSTRKKLLAGSLYCDFWDENSVDSIKYSLVENKYFLLEINKYCIRHLMILFIVFHNSLIIDTICVFLRWIQLELLECLIYELLCFYFQGQNDAAEIRTGNFRFHW